MLLESESSGSSVEAPGTGVGTIDTDVHTTFPQDSAIPRSERCFGVLTDYLEPRWVDRVRSAGIRTVSPISQTGGRRSHAARTDSMPTNGGPAGSDPRFARAQLLDEYDLGGAVLNGQPPQAGHDPVDFTHAVVSATNDWHHDYWLADDPRWYASILVPPDSPEKAVSEIERCSARSDRFLQVYTGSGMQQPLGHQRYWPIFEAAEAHGLPFAVHVAGYSPYSRVTAGGMVDYYFETSAGYDRSNFPLVSSLIFEGVFDRFPGLKVAILESGWGWAPFFGARLDATWRVLKGEVPHLQRRPSEYLADHFWYSTQPIDEPPVDEWFAEMYEELDAAGMGDKLMFSSDYPHWNFDSPTHAIPSVLPAEARAKVLSSNAAALYNLGTPEVTT